jgi:hypothetical protein
MTRRILVVGALALVLAVIILVSTMGIGSYMPSPGGHTSVVTSSSVDFSAANNSVSSLTTTYSDNTFTTKSLRVCTTIPNLGFMYCGGPLRISAIGGIGGGGEWNLTASINTNSVARGQSIRLVANLTNIGQNITINRFVVPFINPVVFATNGTKVWEWNPSATVQGKTIATGETIWQDVSIPTSQLPPGQYEVRVAPISVQLPTPNNLTFTFQFSVR